MATIYIKDSIAERLRILASKEKRTPGQQVSVALDQLESNKNSYSPIQEKSTLSKKENHSERI